jgi:hypothetical protein
MSHYVKRRTKEHHQLEFEEDHWINRRTPFACIGLVHELVHEGEIKRSLHMTVEVILRYQFFQ